MTLPVAIIADADRDAAAPGHRSRPPAVAVALRSRGIDARRHAYGVDLPFDRDRIAWTLLSDEQLTDSSAHVVLLDRCSLSPAAFTRAAAPGSLVLPHDYGNAPVGAVLVASVAREASREPVTELEARRTLSHAGQESVDDSGALRVAFAIDELARQTA